MDGVYTVEKYHNMFEVQYKATIVSSMSLKSTLTFSWFHYQVKGRGSGVYWRHSNKMYGIYM